MQQRRRIAMRKKTQDLKVSICPIGELVDSVSHGRKLISKIRNWDMVTSRRSLCDGSYNSHVHTNRSNAPISKYSPTDISILNINCWISKVYILMLNKILHLRAVPGVEFGISIPKTCSLYTCIKYSDITHNTLLTQICDMLLTHANILLSCQPPFNIYLSCNASSNSRSSQPYT